MNIFVTDYSPKIAAQNLCDSHVVKMVLESTQLLCTHLNKQGVQTPYKSTHVNHPCSLWVEESSMNRQWLYDHFIALSDEYLRRYGKVHKCLSVCYSVDFEWYFQHGLEYPTKFCLCMPEEFIKDGDPVQSYRNYYRFKFNSNPRLRKYTNREIPQWLQENMKGELKC